MTIKELQNYKKVLILGYGVEGKTTEEFFKKFLPDTTVLLSDLKDGPDYLRKQDSADLVIKTPGIRPEKVYKPYTTATNIFFANTKLKTIGITGTKGKSTTATLLKHVMDEAGMTTYLLGNIGKPMLSALIEDKNEGYAILELSSYQLEDIQFSPHIGAILNIYNEHHNHASFQDYSIAKGNITQFQSVDDYIVYDNSDSKLCDIVKKSNATKISIDNNKQINSHNKNLIGPHNNRNIQAVYTIGTILHIPDNVIKKGIEKFNGLPHRLEFVGTFNQISFYDDSGANNPESTIGALQGLGKVNTILLGGQNRGFDFSNVIEMIHQHNVSHVVLFPDTDTEIERLIQTKYSDTISIFKTDSMKSAVLYAYKNTPSNSICLLSPGAPSYLMYDNFTQRGNDFVTLVKHYAHKQTDHQEFG